MNYTIKITAALLLLSLSVFTEETTDTKETTDQVPTVEWTESTEPAESVEPVETPEKVEPTEVTEPEEKEEPQKPKKSAKSKEPETIGEYKEIIAVSTLSASGLKKSEAVSLTDALRSDIGRTGKYEVMERAKMDEILEEQGFQRSEDCDEATCAMEMGKLLAVKYVVLGNVGKVGKTLTLNVRLVNVGTGEIVIDITEYHKGTIDELLTTIVPVAAKKIAKTYKKKKKRPGLIIAISTIVAAAIAAPVVYFATQDDGGDEITATDIKIIW